MMMEVINAADVLDAIVNAKMDHDAACCGYQEDEVYDGDQIIESHMM